MGTDNETSGAPGHDAATAPAPWRTAPDQPTTAVPPVPSAPPWSGVAPGAVPDGGAPPGGRAQQGVGSPYLATPQAPGAHPGTAGAAYSPVGAAPYAAGAPYPTAAGAPYAAAPPRRGPAAWLLLLPAFVALLLGQVVPTVALVVRSLGGAPAQAYEDALVRLPGPFLATAGSALLPALVGFAIGHGTGRLLARSRRTLAIGTGVLGALLVTVAPASAALGAYGGSMALGEQSLLPLLTMTWLPAALVVGALVGATTTRLAGLRTSLVAGAVTCLAAVALGTQAFSPYVLAVPTPITEVYQRMLMFDPNAAAAFSVLVLVPSMVLGVVAALLLVGTRLRVDLPAPTPPAGPHVPAENGSGVVGLVLAGIIAVGLVVLAWPWLSQLGVTEVVTVGAPSGPMIWSGGGSVAQGVLAVVIAGCGAYAIGYLRPLGEASERLLLLFAPWLLVGVAPLIVEYVWFFQQDLGGTMPPVRPQVLVVPVLFLLTYVFAAARRAGARAAVTPVVAALLLSGTLVAWLAAQDVLWAVATFAPDRTALSVVLSTFQRTFGELPLGYLTPIPVVLLVAATFAVTVSHLATMRLATDGKARRFPPA